MPRFYTEISKEDFLTNVKTLMDNDEFPYEMPKIIERDLGKVNFDWENYTEFGYRGHFANYPMGYKELKPGFHAYFVNAGGDWEFPICFIFYWGDNKLRAYIPEDGNAWNKKEKCAYGSENTYQETTDTDGDYERIEKEISEERMIEEILNHITKK